MPRMTPAELRIRELEQRIEQLELANVRLAAETQEVAAANVNAAMQLVELSEARARELEAKKLEVEGALLQAEQASQQKSRLLAAMSHELRTPVSAILGLAELLATGPLQRLQRDHVEAIATTADSFLGLVDQLLDFAKAEAGKIELERIEFDLWSTVESVAQLLQVRADQKGVDLVFSLDAALPRHVVGDPLRLRQVILNLGTNAVKFTQQGMVRMTVERRPTADGGEGVEVCIVDTGCGFSPEVGKRLFEPFAQAEASTARRFGGSGLGLAICRHLVECMQGRLWFESEPGQGSIFGIHLPLLPAPPKSEPIQRPGRVRIVAVRPSTQALLEQHVTRLGGTVVSESDAGPADLLVLEAAADPLATLQQARRTWCDTPAILVSCPGTQILDADLERLGVIGVMTRPTRPSRFAALLTGRQSAPLEARPGTAAFGGMRVLVAEDTATNRRVLEAQLQRLGCTVVAVEDGAAALVAWRAAPFDLVLMDCQMPEVDGYAATAAIRAEEASTGRRRTHIVALSADVQEENRRRCLAVGMDEFAEKPLRTAELREKLSLWHPPT